MDRPIGTIEQHGIEVLEVKRPKRQNWSRHSGPMRLMPRQLREVQAGRWHYFSRNLPTYAAAR